jgi:hypothetical protein
MAKWTDEICSGLNTSLAIPSESKTRGELVTKLIYLQFTSSAKVSKTISDNLVNIHLQNEKFESEADYGVQSNLISTSKVVVEVSNSRYSTNRDKTVLE